MRLTLYPTPSIEAERSSALEAWSALTEVPTRIELKRANYDDWHEEWNDRVFWLGDHDEWVTPEDKLFRYNSGLPLYSIIWVIKRMVGTAEQIVGILPKRSASRRFNEKTHIEALWRGFGLSDSDYYSIDPIESSAWTPEIGAVAQWLDDVERHFRPRDVVARFRMGNSGGTALIRGHRVIAYLRQWVE